MRGNTLSIEVVRALIFVAGLLAFGVMFRLKGRDQRGGIQILAGCALFVLSRLVVVLAVAEGFAPGSWVMTAEVLCMAAGVALILWGAHQWIIDFVRHSRELEKLLQKSRESEEALRLSESRYRGVVEYQSEFIVRYKPDGTVTFLNDAMCRYLGKGESDVLGRSVFEFIPDETGKENVRKILKLTPENPIVSNSYCFYSPDGREVWSQWNQRAIFDDNGIIIELMSVGRDITRQKRMEKELRRLSFTDGLTGSANRNSFEMAMREYEDQTGIGLMLCDLDGLKIANDTLGHDYGDELLRRAVEIIGGCCDGIENVYRVGGDEFGVFFTGATTDSIHEAEHRIRWCIDEYNRHNPDHPLSISVGFALKDKSDYSMRELFKEADNNMYREKMYSAYSARRGVINTLTRALEARDFITQGHGERLQELVARTARNLGMTENDITGLRLLAQVHDVGKVGISDQILFKPDSLDDKEIKEMQRHCEIGHRIAASSPDLALIAPYILKHHEWWNGQGYPYGLAGEDIPVESRILAIADAYDAMTNDRPYRQAISEEKAVRELRKYAGTQFDPVLVDRFIDTLMEMKREEDGFDEA